MRRWIFALILGLPLAAHAQEPQAPQPERSPETVFTPQGEVPLTPDMIVHDHPDPNVPPEVPSPQTYEELKAAKRIANGAFTQDEALEILNRHREEVQHLPGVRSTSLSIDGFAVTYDSEEPPKGIPAQFEGLPVILERWEKDTVLEYSSHSYNAIIDPFASGQCITERVATPSAGGGTSGPLTLTHGLFGMYFPSHMLNGKTTLGSPTNPALMCTAPPNRVVQTYTANAQRYQISPWAQDIFNDRMNQGISTSVPRGYPQIWDPHFSGTTSSDVAWMSVDTNTVPNDYSLGPNANYTMPSQTRPNGGFWSGEDATDSPIGYTPIVGVDVYIDTADCDGYHGTHTYVAHVNNIDEQLNDVAFSCVDSGASILDNVAHEMRLGQIDPVFFTPVIPAPRSIL